jgi:predicted TIM-barrel fold metal-dependent hydrolase
MAAIMSYVPASQILFGTDYPFVRVETNTSELQQRRLGPSELAAIQRDNVLRLMPQLA